MLANIFLRLHQSRYSALFKLPQKTNFDALVEFEEIKTTENLSSKRACRDKLRQRDGFKLTDQGFDLNQSLAEANYCIFCHHQGKDSCSIGLKNQDQSFKFDQFGRELSGCPLEEKNSEPLRDIFNRVRSIYYDKEDMIETFEIEKDLNFDYKINSVYSRGIFECCIEKADYIDQIISSYLIEKRTINDMSLIIACILRAAISESIIYKDLPYRVIIKEYTDIAREFCSQIGEVNFVNSILDKITKKLNAQ
jgi:transcription termination factor NusB